MKKIIRFMPLIVFLGLSVFLYRGLYLHPHDIPSVLLEKKVPALALPNMEDGTPFDIDEMKGKVWFLNVWASWCEACRDEHAVMMDIAHESVPIIGMAYRDERQSVSQWLKQYGSPYQTVLLDREGACGMDWGVYGAPETFIIDKKGTIRYKHLGAISKDTWQNTLKPIYLRLLKEEVT